MRLNPFENIQNEYNLKDVIFKEKNGCYAEFKTKDEYIEKLGTLEYEMLVKCINTNIEWHILDIGYYQGDYFYFSQYNNKFYFVCIGYGSCSGCDALMACSNIEDFSNLQDEIKRDIREFDNLEDLVNWIISSTEWWCSEKDSVLDFVKEKFNVEFEMYARIKTNNKEEENNA